MRATSHTITYYGLPSFQFPFLGPPSEFYPPRPEIDEINQLDYCVEAIRFL